MQRWWLITDESDPAPSLPAGNTARWQADDIAAGLPWVQAATQDLFIPQTLNLDLIDGVSFTKGCYPGQEVVARRHYRGTVNRRTAVGLIAAPAGLDAGPLAAMDPFNARQTANPHGPILTAPDDGRA